MMKRDVHWEGFEGGGGGEEGKRSVIAQRVRG